MANTAAHDHTHDAHDHRYAEGSEPFELEERT